MAAYVANAGTLAFTQLYYRIDNKKAAYTPIQLERYRRTFDIAIKRGAF